MPFKFYQIIVLIVTSVMLAQGITRILTNYSSQSVLKVLVRLIVWLGMLIIAFYPSVTDSIARFIGIEGNINAVILIGFLLIFLIVFRLLSIIERIERDISILTRKEALKPESDERNN